MSPAMGDVEVAIHPREVRMCRWCVGVVCFLAWFLTQVFRCGKGWIRLVAADLDHLRVTFSHRAAFSACSHLMKLYNNSRTPVQQRSVHVNLIEIETWNRFLFLSILGAFPPDLFIASRAKSQLRNPSEFFRLLRSCNVHVISKDHCTYFVTLLYVYVMKY